MITTLSVRERNLGLKFDEDYVHRSLTAKALLRGKEARFIFADRRISATIRAALRRAFPETKFSVFILWRRGIQIRWMDGPEVSTVETIAANALNRLVRA
jgi:hypothetical protein